MCAKTDFDAKLSVLMRLMRAQIKRIEEGEKSRAFIVITKRSVHTNRTN